MHWILRLFLYCFSLVMYANVSGKMTRLTIHTLYCVCCTHIYMFHISLLCTGFYICFFIVSLLLCNPMYLEKWRGSQFIHYNEYVAHIYTLPSRPLLPYNLVHTCFEVRWDVGAHVMRQVNYVHALHKFRSLRITLWYNVLPLITFTMLSTNPQPNPTLVRLSITIVLCTLDCYFHVSKVQEHREWLFTFACIMWKSNLFCLKCHIFDFWSW